MSSMSSRRNFLKDISYAGVGIHFVSSCQTLELSQTSSWKEISDQYYKHPNDLLNFNTGSAGCMPIPIYNSYVANTKKLCSHAPYEVKDAEKTQVAASMQKLASMVGVEDDTLTLVRNTTEGINLILQGYPFSDGDEIVISDMAYPYVNYTLKNMRETTGIIIKTVPVTIDDSDSEIIRKYDEVISSNTALVIITAVTHQIGFKMPVEGVCRVAHVKGVEVLVDGAHCVGQMHQDLKSIDCDYYISSLHKWLSAPLGTGMLYIRPELISKIKPFFSCPKPNKHSMQKFEYTGTISFQNAMTLGSVLHFQETIGVERKYDRILFLAKRLMDGLEEIPNVKLASDLKRYSGIISFSTSGMSTKKVVKTLEQQYNIHAKNTARNKMGLVRASVNLHLLENDIDYFAQSINAIVNG